MTALMASMGLLPAAISTQIGSEIQKPLAIVIVGGILVAMVLTLLFLPLIFEMAYAKEEKNKPSNKP
jgi:heavy metal efflux system protein